MRQIYNTIVILFCIVILGFFANFARNDYGMQLVSVTLFVISTLCIYNALQKINRFKFLGSILMVCMFLLMLISVEIKEDLIISGYMFPILFMMTIFPLMVKIAERKKTVSEVMQYYEWFGIGLLCLGNCMKKFHMAGTGPVLVLSGLMVIPLFYDIFRIKGANLKSLTGWYDLFKNLMIATCLLGFIFKIQHWPGASMMLTTATSMFLLCLISIVILSIRHNINHIGSGYFTRNLSFFGLSVLLVFFQLRMFNLVPKIYSAELPQALYILESRKGDFSEEERKFQKKYNIYQNYYFEFLSNQEDQLK